MPTNYPGSSDSFGVPSSPATTPLSSAGSGGNTRNHTQHHKDLGDAVMAIQNTVTQKTHSHDGNALNGPKLLQVNTHQSPDTDASALSLHHTLGSGATQAAPGNHVHSQYVDLYNAQTITGKKIFPTGTNAPEIPSFNYSQHNHINAVGGGPSFTAFDLRYQGARDLPANSSKKENITGYFTIPSGTALTGMCIVQYKTIGSTSNQEVKFWATMSWGGESTYLDSESAATTGYSDGLIYTRGFVLAWGPSTEARNVGTIVVPFYATASGSKRLKLFMVNQCDKSIHYSYHCEYKVVPNAYRDPNTWS